MALQGLSFGDHAAHGHRQAGGGDHQQDLIDLIGFVEITEPFVTDDVRQRNRVDGADDLDDGGRRSQNCRALQEGLLFKGLVFCHPAVASLIWNAVEYLPYNTGMGYPLTTGHELPFSIVTESIAHAAVAACETDTASDSLSYIS